jgi:hypothetical protein
MAEKRTIELEIQDNSKTLKQQYKEAVKELQNMVAAYGEMSDEAINAAKRAADLKDQIEDTNDLMKSFKGEGTFIAMGQAMSSVASGFSAIEGGLALVGVESEKIQETMLRVQAAMALAQGLEGLEDAGRAFSVLGTKAANALKGIRTGIAATGIGLLVVAVGTLVAYWDDIKAAVNGVSSEQKKLNTEAEKNASVAKETYDSFLLQENALRLQGKSEKEILQLRMNRLNTAIEEEAIRIQIMEETAKLEIEAAKRNQEIAKGVIRVIVEGLAWTVRAIALPIDVLIVTANKLADILGFNKVTTTTLNAEITKMVDSVSTSLASLMFDPDAIKAESDATIKQAKQGLNQMKSDRDGFELQLKNSEAKAAASTVSTAGKTAKELKDIERQLIDEKLRIMEDGFDKEYAILKEKRRRDIEDAEKDFKDGVLRKADYEKLLKQTDESFEADRKKLYDKSFNDRLQQRDLNLTILSDEKKQEAEIEMAAWMEKRKKQKERDAEEIAARRKKEELILMSIKDSLQVASNLTELFAGKSDKQQKKAFMIQKGINIANATVDTYGAATKALREYTSPFNYIAMAAAITAGLLNIKKIQQTQFNASGSGGGGSNVSANAPEAMTANFSTIGSSGINQLAQLQQKPTQAYVVSGEVTSAQALDRNRVQNATL